MSSVYAHFTFFQNDISLEVAARKYSFSLQTLQFRFANSFLLARTIYTTTSLVIKQINNKKPPSKSTDCIPSQFSAMANPITKVVRALKTFFVSVRHLT